MQDKEYWKEWRKNNKEKIKKSNKRYYEKNKEKLNEKAMQWYREHQEWQKEYYEKNKEKIYESNKKWREKNKDKFAKLCNDSRKRRVEKMKADGIINPWGVINKGEEPRYASNNNQES